MADNDAKYVWKPILQLVGQWTIIGIALIAGWINMDRRITILEAGIEQERKGYNIAFSNLINRLDRFENKLDVLLEKAHVHN